MSENDQNIDRQEDSTNHSENITNHESSEATEKAENGSEADDLLHKIGLGKRDRLKKENTDLKHQLSELNDRYLRLFAEFDNFKKRNARERIEFAKTVGSDVISSLLPVLDDFSRAMKQMENVQDVNALKEGVALIQQKLSGVLENKGLKPMKAMGEVFNSELHDAIAEIEAPDPSMKGKVVDEIEKGYFLNDKILRHAKVVVGK